jgi:hypothetical protein
MQHPDLIMLMHESTQRAEAVKRATVRPHADRLGPISTARAVIGNALIALGTHIAPAPRRAPLTTAVPRLSVAGTTRT